MTTHLESLAAAGCEFTAPKRGQKGPRVEGWPQLRLTPDDLRTHLANGGNLGVHCTGYSGARTLAYFDADDAAGLAALLAVEPALQATLRSWRASGSGKIIIWTDGPFQKQATPDLAGDHSKRELICTGQATIFGVHPSGQAYETNWLPPIHLSLDQVKSIWQRWTGQRWQERTQAPARPAAAPTATKPRTDDAPGLVAIKAAWPPLAVFERFGFADQADARRNGEVKLGGHGGLLVKGDEWYSHTDQVGGDSIAAWAYCTRLDSRRDFLIICDAMADAAGLPRLERSAADRNVGDVYDAARRFLAWTMTPAALQDIRSRADDAGMSGRGVLGMQKALQALGELATAHVTMRLVGVSSRKLAEMTAQSHVAARNQMERLATLGYIVPTGSNVVEIRQLCESFHKDYAAVRVNFQQPGALAVTLADDMFSISGSYTSAISHRTAPTVLLRNAGPAARHIWAALQETDGSTSALADTTGLTVGEVRGALKRLAELRLISYATGAHGRRSYALSPGAAARLDTIRPMTTTYANGQRRAALFAGERAAHLQKQLKHADLSEVARLKMRIDREMQRANAIKTWLDGAGILPAKGFDFDMARFYRQRDADKRRGSEELRDLAKQFEGMDRAEAVRTATMFGGWTVAEAAQAWSYGRVAA